MKIKQSQLIAKGLLATKREAFSLVEVVLATSIFILLATALAGSFTLGPENNALSGNRNRAVYLAGECIEASRNIRDNNFASLVDGTYGLATSSNTWIFSGSSDSVGLFTRQVTIASVDADTKSVDCQVDWQQNLQRDGQIVLTTYLSNWQETVAPPATTCTDYCNSVGRMFGTCRPNSRQCTNNSEVHEPGGDVYCTGGPSADTCCCSPF